METIKGQQLLKKVHFTEVNRYGEGSCWRMSVQLNGVSYAEVGETMPNLFLKALMGGAIAAKAECLFHHSASHTEKAD